jgi:dnd system-associated protein 4
MNSVARDTVNIDESVHEIYKQLTEGSDVVNAPFKTMKDVFLWAMCLGFKKGERVPIKQKKLTIFRVAQFNQQVDLPIIKAVALSSVMDIRVLTDSEEVLKIAEEYANAGITIVNNSIVKDGISRLFSLVSELSN